MILIMLAAIPFVSEDLYAWMISGAVVVIGLFIYGMRDVQRFSVARVRAISSVSFAESIRRRVLWITPLAMIGVVLISQLQKPLDEQDAIRQTIKFTLFASGLVVTITGVILACTNLPKEIDTRVIYTIVTKPTTRLEIVVGKVWGFAKVSLAILALMGVFAMAYLHLRAWTLQRFIGQRLEAGAIDPLSRPTYEYWKNQGLLSSRTFARPDELQVFARRPEEKDTKRWFFGNDEGEMLVPFKITQADLVPPGGQQPGELGLVIRLVIGYDYSTFGRRLRSELPVGVAAPQETITGPQPPPKTALISVAFLDQNFENLIDLRHINGGRTIALDDPSGTKEVYIPVSPEAAPTLLQVPLFYVDVTGRSPGVVFSADIKHDPDPVDNPVCLIVPPASQSGSQPRFIAPMDDGTGKNQPALPTFRSRGGLYGQQLRGGSPDAAPVALYKYRGQDPNLNVDGKTVGFELKIGIERSGDDAFKDNEADLTRLELIFANKGSGQTVGPITLYPENKRTLYFNVPAEAVKGGNFDLYVRNLSRGHFAGLVPNSITMVAGIESFDLNLIKSLFILWMLSILVVIISIFCSTFLSWPIAIMLTLMMLLGHWAVIQLSGTLAPGIGNQVATDLFGAGSTASNARVVSSTVEAMSRVLNTFGSVLPDIGQFSAIEDIERGVTIAWPKLLAPLGVLAMFGLPMITLSYVLLRNKEVAP